MKKSIKYIIPLVVAGAALGFTLLKPLSGNHASTYKTSELYLGDVINSVSSTGTIEAKSTVEVGTQVSGIIDHIYVDFNDVVKKGQLMAVLDTVLLSAAQQDAEAGVDKARALLDQAQADFDRYQPMFEKGLVSASEFQTYRINVKTQTAALKSAQVALKRATQNLDYAFIYSPISGTIIQRSVEEGQTVAASMSTPTLFIIAEDLASMEIHANVDESDIGMIKQGQRVTFDVLAYPDKEFEGTVRQIRLQPTTEQNVVNYTVVIETANKDHLLLPGMTATVDFIIAEKKNVLLTPASALRFEPSETEKMAAMETMHKNMPSPPDSVRTNMPQDMPPPGANMTERQLPEDAGELWYLDSNKKLCMAPVRKGATDGKVTEIIGGPGLEPGTKVITAYLKGDSGTSQSGSESNNRRMGGPPRPF